VYGGVTGSHAIPTSIVFDAHVYTCINQVGRYVHWLLGIYKYILMILRVVCWSCSNAKHVLLRVRDFWHSVVGFKQSSVGQYWFGDIA
jgi:hypothetical protein